MTQSLSPFGESTQKYWDKRHRYFSKWDDGIQTDAQGLYSVKPEKFALEIAQTLPGTIVLDAFCGIGGSAIGFALCGKRVVSVDIDESRLRMAAHNAALYGVADKIDFMQGDIATLYDPLFDTLHFDALHIDPPWGGPDYYKKEVFGWADFAPDPLPLIHKAVQAKINVAVGLPVNFDAAALDKVACKAQVTDAHDGTKLLFRTAYFLA